MTKSIKAQLRDIATNGARTDRQRAFIVEQSNLMGVQFVVTTCRDCYKDQAAVLWRMIAEQEMPASRKYVLRAGKDVIWRGKRVNATCSEAELKALLEAGFPREFFSKINGKCV